jgi:hypothetical protein
MNENFENQKEKLVSIKHEISLLYQQVNYLLRNERPLELLDLDVLMNRTHTLYDMLCSVNVGEMGDDEDLPFDAEDFSGLFGGMMKEEEEAAPESEPEPELVVDEDPEPVAMEEPEPVVTEESEPVVTEEPEPTIAPEPVEEPEQEETPVAVIEEVVDEPVVQDEVKEVVEPEPEIPSTDEAPAEEMPLKDEYGLFFRFEDIPEKEEEKEEEKPHIEVPHIIEEEKPKVVHMMEVIPEEEIPERDRIHGEELVPDNPFEMPKMEGPTLVDLELENERQTSETVGDFFEQDDAEFELSTPETLGEKMMSEEVTLAEKFQQNPVRDLRSAIGINDKFLFVNELFGGSMEKYNKSIENLNDLKTLNGAMIYLNELKVELQWNSSNEAYQRLKDLVSRKFE